jgi:hypothetical protein
MRLLSLLLLAVAPTQSDQERTYLASVEGIHLVDKYEMIESFHISSWGVHFLSVCHIPVGWTITAGGSLTPEGLFEGQGGLGVSMPREANPKSFRSLVLVRLGRVQRRDVGATPATFKGHATAWDGGDSYRKVTLTYKNIRLVAARRCPS